MGRDVKVTAYKKSPPSLMWGVATLLGLGPHAHGCAGQTPGPPFSTNGLVLHWAVTTAAWGFPSLSPVP